MVGEMVEGEQLDLFSESCKDPSIGPVVVHDLQTTIVTLPECPIASTVMKKVKERADVGKRSYGKTMARTDISTKEWIDNTIEELLDAACYLTRLKEDL